MYSVSSTVPEDYKWIVILGGIACAAVGIGIGANDVANNFGPAIGSGSITFLWGVAIAAVFEFLGAVFFSSSVTASIKENIYKSGPFDENPALLMFVNLVALMVSASWLWALSIIGIPVSTTHTAIGTLLGVGIGTGEDIIKWDYIGYVIMSWFISPILSLIVAIIMFYLMRKYILRSKHGIKRAVLSLWIIAFFSITLFAIFFIMKYPKTKPYFKENTGASWGIAFGLSFGLCLFLVPLISWYAMRVKNRVKGSVHPVPLLYRLTGFPRFLNGTEEEEDFFKSKFKKIIDEPTLDKDNSYSDSLEEDSSGKENFKCNDCGSKKIIKDSPKVSSLDITSEEVDCNAAFKKRWYALPWFMDLHADALQDEAMARIEDKSEEFAINIEQYFSTLQIMSSVVCCIVHGANDTANAIAPFSSIFSAYENNAIVDDFTTPTWISALGGGTIAIGVLTMGHRVIQSIGMKLIKTTPSRSFVTVMAAVIVLVFGSMIGLPLSTTHCILGATVGVGLIDKHSDSDMVPSKRNLNGLINTKAVNLRLILKITIAMILTLILTALVAALLFAFAAFSP